MAESGEKEEGDAAASSFDWDRLLSNPGHELPGRGRLPQAGLGLLLQAQARLQVLEGPRQRE